ncbi:MAG: DUF3617 family protein, partial [Bacteriovoracaceae bacterium]
SFELKPGLWKLETEIETPQGTKSVQESLPAQKEEGPHSLTEMCVTEEESKLETSLVKDGECKFINITQSKDELSGDIACTQKRTGKARWKKISDDEFIMTMETQSNTGPVKLTQRGHFIDKNCTKS